MRPPCRPSDTGNGGFVLVNALVIVAALAMLATLLLVRAEGGRARLQAGLEADQLTLALDAFEALALTRLARDTTPTDYPGDSWDSPAAEEATPLPLARGTVTGRISDLQGRFNINWLSDPGNQLAADTFDRLLRQLALPAQTAEAIRRFLRPGGPGNSPQARARWQRLDPPQDPVGGPVLSADQLSGIPGLPARSYDQLRPLITALPGSTQLNVNSAPPEVLAALLPHLPPAALARLIAARRQQPFASVEAFLIAARLEATLADEEAADEGEEDPARLTPDHLSVSSAWFRTDSEARLERFSARRTAVLFRAASGQRPELIWQVTTRP